MQIADDNVRGRSDGKPEAYFRGRKFKGREVKVSPGYKGLIIKAEAKSRWDEQRLERMTTDLKEATETAEGDLKFLEKVGTFDEVVIWGHEATAENDDVFVKGLGEWLDFAQSVRRISIR